MKQLEDDVVEAFRLIPTFGLVVIAADAIRRKDIHPRGTIPGVDDGCLGLPVKNPFSDPSVNAGIKWPDDVVLAPPDIEHLIIRTGAQTYGEFLDRVRPLIDAHLYRQAFILLVTAVDSFLDRRGFDGTLGQRFSEVKKQRIVPVDLDRDMQEIIQRRNDVAA